MFLSDFDVTPFFPQSGMTYAFDWFTLAYAIILVVCMLLGLKNGFLSTIINALGGIIVLVLAFLLAKPLGNLLCNSFGWGAKLSSAWYDWLAGKSADMTVAVEVENAESALTTALSSTGLPNVVCSLILKLALPFVPAEGTFTAAAVLGDALANYCFIVGAFIILAIILLIVLIIIKKIVKNLVQITFIKVVDKILGVVSGLLVGAVVIVFISYGLSFLIAIPQCTDVISNAMFLSDDTVWTFSKAVYNYNLVGKLFALYL